MPEMVPDKHCNESVIYQIALLPMVLSDVKGHFSTYKDF